ncbi:hypothetical protein [Streptomyces sp. ODS28]|uniref:hypothetical protein n=1 Tax=Streptomyces sp. ODS28 TaxID=3136688 RepID=UPI0031E6E227
MTDEHVYADPVADTQRAVDELRAALHAVGLTLPSLGIDLISYAQQTPDPLVALGRCNRETARRLASVLRGRAPR